MEKNLFHRLEFKKTARDVFIILGFFCLVTFSIRTAIASSETLLKDDLRQQINDLRAQIDSYRSNITDLRKQTKTLKRDISLLDNKIKAAELEIKQVDLSIKQTESEIAEKDSGLQQAQQKIDRERAVLGEYVRLVNEYDQQDLLESILSDEKLSDLFERISALEDVQQKIQDSLVAIKQLKVTLEDDKQTLEDRRGELNQLKVLQQIQKRTIVAQEQDKKDLLNQTKGQESNFQKLLAKAKSDAEAIRNQLYLLEGVGLSMSLIKAYDYAKKAADLTGVRSAFLLAVLKKESSWGEKVGTGTWRKDMNPRDQKAFVQICDELNLNPDKTPVSRKPAYGWGGAMGPAQFLPSVWLQYESQVAQLTGHNPPDPWDIEDAFVAAGVKLAQAGANARTEVAEWKAAQIYFAGSRWNKPTYYFYGDQVMELTAIIQEQLNLIVK